MDRGDHPQSEGFHLQGHRQRQNTAWDPPHNRRHQGRDHRQTSAWDAPHQRGFSHHSGSDSTRGIKMSAPRFDGSDATNWISRVQYYFDHIDLQVEDRLHYVVMLFDPPATEWIFNYKANNRFTTWFEFLEDVRHKFDPRSFKNFIEPLAKLVQTGSVVEYHDTFERYLNKVEGLSEEALIPMFVEGLKQPLQEKVELAQPVSLAAAMALALRLSANQEYRTHQPSRYQKRQWSGKDSRQQSGKPPSSSAQQQPSPPSGQSGNSRPREQERGKFAPIMVSNAEKAERSRRGLCWHCPEKYSPSHVCAVKMLCYVGEDEDESNDPDDHLIAANLSHLHALDGNNRSKPFHVLGTIGDTDVKVLIDTG